MYIWAHLGTFHPSGHLTSVGGGAKPGHLGTIGAHGYPSRRRGTCDGKSTIHPRNLYSHMWVRGRNLTGGSQPAKLPLFGGYSLETLTHTFGTTGHLGTRHIVHQGLHTDILFGYILSERPIQNALPIFSRKGL